MWFPFFCNARMHPSVSPLILTGSRRAWWLSPLVTEWEAVIIKLWVEAGVPGENPCIAGNKARMISMLPLFWRWNDENNSISPSLLMSEVVINIYNQMMSAIFFQYRCFEHFQILTINQGHWLANHKLSQKEIQLSNELQVHVTYYCTQVCLC